VDTLGWLKFRNQDKEGALPLLKRAYDLNSDNGEIGYHFAVALEAMGKRAEAKSLLQSIISKNMTFDDVDDAKRLLAQW
jgi:thioredoxin-like negative regulator of GroEL